MEPAGRPGSRCRCALGLALFFDALGLAGLLLGGLLDSSVSDLLIYLGGVGLFFSLPWWVFWQVGKLEVPPEELREDEPGQGWRGGDTWSLDSWRARRLALLARAFSARFSLASAASVPSQGGRLRAHFAASATTGGSLSRASDAEKLPRSAPRRASFSTPQDSLGSSGSQDHGKQESSKSNDLNTIATL